jgi:hypothetical protein
MRRVQQENTAMGKRIDQFCEDLRTKLTRIDTGLDDLKGKIDSKAQNAEQDVRNHLDKVQKRIAQDKGKVSAAQTEMKNWAEARKVETQDKIAEWKSKRETSKLQNRADRAEQYAAAAITVAAAAVDEAEQASVEAWLARQDADYVQAKQAVRA